MASRMAMRNIITLTLSALVWQAVSADPVELKIDGLGLGMAREKCDQIQLSQDGSLPREGFWAPGVRSVLYYRTDGTAKNPTVAVFDESDRLVLVKGGRLQVNAESFTAGEKIEKLAGSLGGAEVERDGWTSMQDSSNPGPDFEERCNTIGVEGVGAGYLHTNRSLLYPSLGLSVEASGLTSDKVFTSAELVSPQSTVRLPRLDS